MNDMNKIEEIKKAASALALGSSDNEVDFSNAFVEIFAEMIVRECINIAWNYEPDEDGSVETAIRKHFSIKG
jgi:hypothetical protein